MYTVLETKTVPINDGSISYRVRLQCDTSANMPEVMYNWAVGSELEVLENGGAKYRLGDDRKWYKINFKTGSGGGDNSDVVDQVNQNTSNISLVTGRVSRIETNIGDHTIKSDVPENAVFTDTVYDDSEVKEDIEQNKTDILKVKGTKINGVTVTGELDSQNDLKIAGKITEQNGFLFRDSNGNQATGDLSIVCGLGGNTASATASVIFGEYGNTVSGQSSFAGGGSGNSVSSGNSFAFGSSVQVKGSYGVGFGGGTLVEGQYAIAAGGSAKAIGNYSQAFGRLCTASAEGGFVTGYDTVAASPYQTVHGKYNIEDNNDKYAFVIGNGDEEVRSNALAIGWDGKIYVGNSETGIDLNDLLNRIIALENK